jgi:integrase/recombinase XerC
LETYFRNKDPKTVRVYARCLEDFREWLGSPSVQAAAAAFLSGGQGNANMTMMNFKDHLKKVGYAPSSVNTHLVAIRSLVKVGRLLGQIPWMLDVENVRNEVYRNTAGPGTKKFQEVWAGLATKTDSMSIRDRTILALAHDGGLRRDEIESIDLEHLDWAADRVWVRAKKKNARVSVPLNRDLQTEIKKWISIRGDAPGALFKNFHPGGLGERLTGTSIDRICKKHGLGHVHGLRHLAVTEALEVTNGNIAEVMKFSRHSDPKTVMIYDDNRKNVSGAISAKLAEMRNGRGQGKGPEQP